MKGKMIVSSLVSIMMLSQMFNINVFANTNEEVQVQKESVVSNQSENIINKINIAGIGVGVNGQLISNTGFTINFDKAEKKIKISDFKFETNRIHDSFGNSKYLEVKLYGADGKEKKSVMLTGNDRVYKIREINGADFEYGDYIKIYHAEGEQNHRYNLTESVIDKKDGLKDYTYRITENGLQQIFVINNQIQMSGHPLESHKYRGFKIKFDTVNKKVKVDEVWAPTYQINPHKNGEYMKITLYNGQTDEIKKTLSINAKDKTAKANEFNNNNGFEYGDYLEIFHAEGVHRDRFDITGNVINKNSNRGQKYIYKITKNGLEQIKK